MLAHLRRRRAEACIPDSHRSGRLLDIGCGAAARFARETRFAEKYGVDQLPPVARTGLLSAAGIGEHQNVLGRKPLVDALAAAGFRREHVDSGYFELGLNIWAAATK